MEWFPRTARDSHGPLHWKSSSEACQKLRFGLPPVFSYTFLFLISFVVFCYECSCNTKATMQNWGKQTRFQSTKSLPSVRNTESQNLITKLTRVLSIAVLKSLSKCNDSRSWLPWCDTRKSHATCPRIICATQRWLSISSFHSIVVRY